jgi:hypothetical protein
LSSFSSLLHPSMETIPKFMLKSSISYLSKMKASTLLN